MKNVTRVYHPEHGFGDVMSDFIAFARESNLNTSDPSMDDLAAMTQQQQQESAELTLRATAHESYQHEFEKRQASRYDRFQSALGQLRARFRKNRPMLALLDRFKRRAKKAAEKDKTDAASTDPKKAE